MTGERDDGRTPRGTGPRRALIVRGGWEGHSPVGTTEVFVPWLVGRGYEIQVESSPEVYADRARMAGVDVVVQVMTTSRITGAQAAGLRDAVAAGTGLAGWHGGIVDAFRDSVEYQQLVGAQFVHHPAKAAPDDLPGDGTDDFVEHTVTVVPERAGHPVVAGISGYRITTEQYWVLSDSYNDVLATTTVPARPHDPWTRPVPVPAVWTRRWGAGRVFVCTTGHLVSDVEHPTVRTIIERGIAWASR